MTRCALSGPPLGRSPAEADGGLHRDDRPGDRARHLALPAVRRPYRPGGPLVRRPDRQRRHRHELPGQFHRRRKWTGSTRTGTILFRPTPSPGRAVVAYRHRPERSCPLRPGHPDPAAGQPVATVVPSSGQPRGALLIRAEALLGDLASPACRGPARPPGPQVNGPLGLSFLGTAAPPSPASRRPLARRQPPSSRAAREIASQTWPRSLKSSRRHDPSPLKWSRRWVAVLSQVLGLAGQFPRAPHLADCPQDPARARSYQDAGTRCYLLRPPHPAATLFGHRIDRRRCPADLLRFAAVSATRAAIKHPACCRPRPCQPGAANARTQEVCTRDESGTWHLAIVQAWNLANDDLLHLRLALLPPLRPGDPGSTGTLTLEVSA